MSAGDCRSVSLRRAFGQGLGECDDGAPGAARNALDCALWDIEAQAAAESLSGALRVFQEPRAIATAYTISLDTPQAMEAAARKSASQFKLLKCKLTGEGDRERIAAVRHGAPKARLIVDANESWGRLDVAGEAQAMAELGVELVEQPLPASRDEELLGLRSKLPFCADESCQSRAELDYLGGYEAVNIKLDKAGGLTESLALADAARAMGKRIMVGCMLGTSLGVAPAFLLAQGADWVDLDGALLLARDRENGLQVRDGLLTPSAIWG